MSYANLSKELRDILRNRAGRKKLQEFLVRAQRGDDEPAAIDLGTRRYTVRSVEGGIAPHKGDTEE